MAAKARFDTEAKHREAQRERLISLTQAQRYILHELRALFNTTNDDTGKRDITLLEEAFRAPLTVAVRKELNLLRRNGVTGEALLRELKRIYWQHNLKDAPSRLRLTEEERLTRIVCSEALV
jgi:hypothetical protein